jgi:hypothetical protein
MPSVSHVAWRKRSSAPPQLRERMHGQRRLTSARQSRLTLEVLRRIGVTSNGAIRHAQVIVNAVYPRLPRVRFFEQR